VAERNKLIFVYAHWEGMNYPKLMGTLSASEIRGKEIFSFEYDPGWLDSDKRFLLDPGLQFFTGPQYIYDSKPNFGIFSDSSPDRWGRMLIKRRESLEARLNQRAERRLLESDYLLGVFDGSRMGGLRFKTSKDGDFLDNNDSFASPPWTSLRELENASLKIEDNDYENSTSYIDWLNLLVAPGSSLGGARPKAGVTDPGKRLWIAKFPSRHDLRDSGLWEMIAYEIAVKAGIMMSECRVESFTSTHHTFLTKRFDRSSKGERIHFTSAMTMLGYNDGADAGTGASYLEIAEFIVRNSAAPNDDLKQLWTRIVFNIAVSNTDDHLRNHGFLLTPSGWRLSPAFDINPEPGGYGLSLNITENDNRLDMKLALDAAPFFRLNHDECNSIIKHVTEVVGQWEIIADKYGISSSEKRLMASAFLYQL